MNCEAFSGVTFECTPLPLLTGTVEADETYLGGRTPRGGRAWRENVMDEIEMGLGPKNLDWRNEKPIVFGMVVACGWGPISTWLLSGQEYR